MNKTTIAFLTYAVLTIFADNTYDVTNYDNLDDLNYDLSHFPLTNGEIVKVFGFDGVKMVPVKYEIPAPVEDADEDALEDADFDDDF